MTQALTPQISIIIPVFNTSAFLHECINSILSQTLKDWELILIDDGSTDNSLSILKGFEGRDSRIKVIHQENQGVSASRNFGIESSRGEYITFIDSDDIVDKDYLYSLSKPLESGKFDLVTSGLSGFDSKGEIYSELLIDGEWDLSNESEYIDFKQLKLNTSPVGKLYRKSIIDQNHIRFNQSISFAEDKEFNIRYYSHISNAQSLSYCGYHYRKGLSNSLSSIKRDLGKIFAEDLRQWSILKTDFDNRHFTSKESRRYLSELLFNTINDYIQKASKATKLTEINRSFDVSISKELIDYINKNSHFINAKEPIKSSITNGHFKVALLMHKLIQQFQ